MEKEVIKEEESEEEKEEVEEDARFILTEKQKESLHLNDETLDAIRDVFRTLDEDESGTLEIAELETAMRSMNVDCSRGEIEELMKQIDVDGNGSLDFFEFSRMVSGKMQEYDPERELKEAFAVFDTNGDGRISVDELKVVVESLGGEMTNEELESMLLEADDNSDGYLDYEEFVKIWIGDTADKDGASLKGSEDSTCAEEKGVS